MFAFIFICIFWTLLHVFLCKLSGWPILDDTILSYEKGIPLRLNTPRYWDQFTWSAAYALCVLKLRYNQNCPLLI